MEEATIDVFFKDVSMSIFVRYSNSVMVGSATRDTPAEYDEPEIISVENGQSMDITKAALGIFSPIQLTDSTRLQVSRLEHLLALGYDPEHNG